MTNYIKVEKIDYYTWKIGTIILLLLCFALIYNMQTSDNKGEINDNWWHIGYKDCERNYNLSNDEQYILNKFRIEKQIQSQIHNLTNGENFTQ